MTTDIKQSIWQKIPFLYPYALLARWDRPIGIWLLYWPCAWGVLLAPSFRLLDAVEQIWYLLLFFIGAVAMRGAGCALNDITDRRLDAGVKRTSFRPLPSGKISLVGACLFMALQALVGLWVLFQLSPMAMMIGFMSVPLIVAYPWMKRITYWPQLFLGIVFNAGILIGWASMENTLSWQPLILYFAAIIWTLAYDSVYAFLDSQDDALMDIKSTVLLWGIHSKTVIGWLWVVCFSTIALLLFFLDGYGFIAWASALLALIINLTAHMFWQVDNDGFTLAFFKLQARIGLLIAMGLASPILL